MADPASLTTIARYLFKLRSKALYPGFPFVSVPAIVLFIIVVQFKGPLSLSPHPEVSALHFKSSLSRSNSVADGEAMLLLVPRGAGRFSLSDSASPIDGVLVSENRDSLALNADRIRLTEQGLIVEDQWVGAQYPLALLLEGSSTNEIIPAGQKQKILPSLEISTSDSVWVALGAAVAAVFSIGLAAGFLKDSDAIA